jgi:hypothetical protein
LQNRWVQKIPDNLIVQEECKILSAKKARNHLR